MTEVRVTKGRSVHRLQVSGHAEGSPEVCAAVSALVYALAGWAENAGAAQFIKLESGSAEVVISGWAAARSAFEVAEIGLRQIAKAYPALVRVSG